MDKVEFLIILYDDLSWTQRMVYSRQQARDILLNEGDKIFDYYYRETSL